MLPVLEASPSNFMQPKASIFNINADPIPVFSYQVPMRASLKTTETGARPFSNKKRVFHGEVPSCCSASGGVLGLKFRANANANAPTATATATGEVHTNGAYITTP